MRSLFFKIFLWFWIANILLAGIAVTGVILLRSPDGPEASNWRSVASQALVPQALAAVNVLGESGGHALFEHLDEQDRAAGTHTFLLDEDDLDLGGHIAPDELLDLADLARQKKAVQVASSDQSIMVAIPAPGLEGEDYVFAREMLPGGERFRGPALREGEPEDFRPGMGRGGPGGPPPDDGRGPPLGEFGPRPPRELGPPNGASGGPRHGGRGPRERPGAMRGPAGYLGALLGDRNVLVALLVAVFLGSGAVCYGLARYLTRPVRDLRGAARRLAEGDLATRVNIAARRRRDEIGQLAIDFDSMAEQIESLVGAHKRLLRDISHELRSPLARLHVALELANRAAPEAAGSLARVGREAERLNDLIGQLLTLARLEARAVAPAEQSVDLGRLVEDVAADAHFEATASDRTVRVAGIEACELRGAADLLRSAIENVLRNAVTYSPAKSEVTIALKVRGERDRCAEIVVRDHGPGVPGDVQRIFEPFYRAQIGNEVSSNGIGLGLAIAEQAIRKHAGSIAAENSPDGGLRVTIRLPIGSATA